MRIESRRSPLITVVLAVLAPTVLKVRQFVQDGVPKEHFR